MGVVRWAPLTSCSYRSPPKPALCKLSPVHLGQHRCSFRLPYNTPHACNADLRGSWSYPGHCVCPITIGGDILKQSEFSEKPGVHFHLHVDAASFFVVVFVRLSMHGYHVFFVCNYRLNVIPNFQPASLYSLFYYRCFLRGSKASSTSHCTWA